MWWESELLEQKSNSKASRLHMLNSTSPNSTSLCIHQILMLFETLLYLHQGGISLTSNTPLSLHPGRSIWPVGGAVGQVVPREQQVKGDHPAHHQQLLPCQPRGQWLPERVLSLGCARVHVCLEDTASGEDVSNPKHHASVLSLRVLSDSPSPFHCLPVKLTEYKVWMASVL